MRNTLQYIGKDYYPFGSAMQGRTFKQYNYKFGFNGHEKEGTDWTGSDGSHLDFGARIYDSRLARFLSTDPWEKKYAWQTPYAYFSNTPIWKIDYKGYGNDIALDNTIGEMGGGGGGAIVAVGLGTAITYGFYQLLEIVSSGHIKNTTAKPWGEIETIPTPIYHTSRGTPFDIQFKGPNGNPGRKSGTIAVVGKLIDMWDNNKDYFTDIGVLKENNPGLSYDKIDISKVARLTPQELNEFNKNRDGLSFDVYNVDIDYKHKITDGQNLTKIAKQYNTSVEELMKLNNISEDSKHDIKAGDSLIIRRETVVVNKKPD